MLNDFIIMVLLIFDFPFLTILLFILLKRLNKFEYNLQFFKKLVNLMIGGLFLEILSQYLSIGWLFNDVSKIYLFNNAFIYSPFISYIKIFICLIVICICYILVEYFQFENFSSYEFLLILGLSVEGMFLLLSVNDFFLMYLALELQSLSLYILAAFKRYSNLSVEAGIKYFIYGSFASGFILFGISLIYGIMGTTNFTTIYSILVLFAHDNSPLSLVLIFGFILIISGLLFKLGIAPFHFWVSDVYEGSDMLMTYFFAVLPKIPVFVILYRAFRFIFHPIYAIPLYAKGFTLWLISCAILSIIIGAIGALYQTSIKRMLAYSAIVNSGFILLGLSTGTVYGLFASIYYLVIYICGMIHIFSILIIIRKTGSKLKLKNLVDFSGITHSNFLLSLFFVFSLLSIAGIPPLIGFFGKFFIFFAITQQGYFLIAIIIVLLSVLTCVYYIRLIRFILFSDKEDYSIIGLNSLSEKSAYLLSFLSIFNLSLFLFQGPLIITFFKLMWLCLECI